MSKEFIEFLKFIFNGGTMDLNYTFEQWLADNK